MRIRVLLVSTIFLLVMPTASAQDAGPAATQVYGQPDFATAAAGHDANGLSFPIGLAQDGDGALYVADRNNSRILVYEDDGDATADRVYGQHGDLDAYTQNNDGVGGSGLPDADTLSFPVAIALDGDDGLYVTDRENHRVLYYVADGDTTADRVYGQFDSFTTNPPNNNSLGGNGIPSAANIGVFALGVLTDGSDGLYISDSSNNRILFYGPAENTNADTVYGQFGDFSTGVENNDGNGVSGDPSAQNLSHPQFVMVSAGGSLYISDTGNNRVLVLPPDVLP